MRIALSCEQCGRAFEAHHSRRDTARFCSQRCLFDHRTQVSTVTRSCVVCGTEFSVLACEIRKGRGGYCSAACANVHKRTRIPVSCKQCGKEFLAKPSALARGESKFCGAACAHLGVPAPAHERFWRFVDKTETCWLWTGKRTKVGYGSFRLGSEDGFRDELAHRFSYRLHKGPIPEGKQVCHDCPGKDNPSCVNPDHLWVGTALENSHDRDVKRLRRRAAVTSQ